MKLAVFSAKPYDHKYLEEVLACRIAELKDAAVDDPAMSSAALAAERIHMVFHESSLSPSTVPLAQGAEAVCVFVNDTLSAEVLEMLRDSGVRAVLLRCAGFNNVDLAAAGRLGLFVANVPSYSPEAVAEFAVALVQTLNRKTHRAYNRVREGNFALDGLLGRTLYGKTVGVVGVGKIGLAFARIMKGFGCHLLAYDPFPSPAFEEYGEYADLDTLLPQCDIVSLHCPLTDMTRHIINERTLGLMRPDAMLVNTSRGGLIDTRAVIDSLKAKRLASLALDVYEGEGALFYNDHSGDIIEDDALMRLVTFPNVLVCGHQAFFTEEALTEISTCTLRNLENFVLGQKCPNTLVKGPNVLVRRDSHPVRAV